MPIQRKIFRVERMGSTKASTASGGAVEANRQAFKIEADGLRQLQPIRSRLGAFLCASEQGKT